MASLTTANVGGDAMIDSLIDAKESVEAAEEMKETGNAYFMAKDLSSALACYTKAIELNPKHHIFYSNRAMCNTAIGDPEAALSDAVNCLKLRPDFIKGHFHKATSEISLGLFEDAEKTIADGMAFEEQQQQQQQQNEETSEATSTESLHVKKKSNFDRLVKTLKKKKLEEKAQPTVNNNRPSIKHFEIGEELGIGNFSRIIVATHKKTNVKYALKIIEKQEVDRMKKRHPNIHNEIAMEKRVLSKFNDQYFQGVIKMFNTFQDYYSLYYQMEYMECGELWSQLTDAKSGALTGSFASIVTRWIAEIVLAIEYIHSRGIIHRDLKPENIMITDQGHIKLIDFGTAKDLIETDLNGPEFVGTPEYMSPEMVTGNGLLANYSADIWALGVITYQMLLGYTPFKAPSPYLTFLLIKKCHISYPKSLSYEQKDFISKCLNIDASERLGKPDETPGNLILMKKHSFFKNIFFYDEKEDDERNKLYDIAPMKVPLLSELCVREIAYKMVASKTKDKNVLNLLSPSTSKKEDEVDKEETLTCLVHEKVMNQSIWADKNRYSLYNIMHMLERMSKINEPRILRSFYHSLNDFRCLRARADRKDYVGLTHLEQGYWKEPFVFVHLNVSLFLNNFMKCSSQKNADASSEKVEDENDKLYEKTIQDMKLVVSSLNRLRPKVCVVCGDFANVTKVALELFRTQVSRISESIPLCFVSTHSAQKAGGVVSEVEKKQDDDDDEDQMSVYSSKLGADYYGFWYGGMRALVLNSSLIIHEEDSLDDVALTTRSREQEAWFDSEVEQGQLGGHHVVVFNFHPWFTTDPLNDPLDVPGQNLDRSVVSRSSRLKWMRKMYEGNVHGVFTSPTTTGPKVSKSKSRIIKPKKFKEILIAAGKVYEEGEDEESQMRQGTGERFMEFVTTSSTCDDATSGFRIISVFEHSMRHQFYALDNIPDRVELLKEHSPASF